jgi:uncharacterized membrane protein
MKTPGRSSSDGMTFRFRVGNALALLIKNAPIFLCCSILLFFMSAWAVLVPEYLNTMPDWAKLFFRIAGVTVFALNSGLLLLAVMREIVSPRAIIAPEQAG